MHSHSVYHSFHELLAHSALVIPEHTGAARRRAALSEHSWHMGHTPPTHQSGTQCLYHNRREGGGQSLTQ